MRACACLRVREFAGFVLVLGRERGVCFLFYFIFFGGGEIDGETCACGGATSYRVYQELIYIYIFWQHLMNQDIFVALKRERHGPSSGGNR